MMAASNFFTMFILLVLAGNKLYSFGTMLTQLAHSLSPFDNIFYNTSVCPAVCAQASVENGDIPQASVEKVHKQVNDLSYRRSTMV